MIWKVRARKR